jgi:hypothetical protein
LGGFYVLLLSGCCILFTVHLHWLFQLYQFIALYLQGLFILSAVYYIYAMKVKIWVVLFLILTSGCGREAKLLREKIAGSDSAAVNLFAGDGTMDTVVRVKIIRDKQELEQLVMALTDKLAKPISACGTDGSIHFFKYNKVIQDIDFRLRKDGCRQCIFVLDGERMCTTPASAADLLLQ